MNDLFGTPDVSFVETIRANVSTRADQAAMTELADGETQTSVLSWGEMNRQALVTAAWLRRRTSPGDRILLIFKSAASFLPGFLGCLYAGTVAVPAPSLRRNQNAVRLRGIAADCGAFLALSDRALSDLKVSLDIPVAIVSDFGQDADMSPHRAKPDDLALLQYTSGSTGEPRGVQLTHGNLTHNIRCIAKAYGNSGDSVAVTWLPFHHDMGLIASILYPLWCGAQIVTMPPAAFLQQPRRWLAAITKYRGTHSAAPNFAYDLCARTIGAASRDGLDLSSWKVASNGGEPVREDTLRRFSEAFAPCGFRREALIPSYGLAESTVLVSADRVLSGEVRIADPDSALERPNGEEGEIWIAGPSVATGYWGRPEETEKTFRGRLAGDNSRYYLRTGDLGFIRDGRLTVSGRLKDLIIIRGVNHYPQDLEFTASECHEALSKGNAAAFSINDGGEERLAVAVEIDRPHWRNFDAAGIFQAIRRALAESHDVQVHVIALLRPHSLPKTTSGKIQRRACRVALAANQLQTLGVWRTGTEIPGARNQPDTDLELWLAGRIAAIAGTTAAEIDPQRPFADYALDSQDAVRLSGEIEERLGRRVPPTVAYDYPTVASLARYLREAGSAEGRAARAEVPQNGVGREGIAIVGMGCRFPGAPNPEGFRRLLFEGRDAVTEIPEGRWDVSRYYDPRYDDAQSSPGSMYTKHGAFLEQVDSFDADFFNITPREASALDPQQRLWLEVAWEALENAGQAPSQLGGTRTGVFAGQCFDDYMRLSLERGAAGIDAYTGLGSSRPATAGRLSYFLGLRGPSIHVDTSCSSSAVAVHLACQSLRIGECDLALAGGVNLMLAPESTVGLCQLKALARDGRSKAFDAAADGYGRGEGCGVVVLKRLSDAIAAGDRIEAVIRASVTNHDGHTNGFTAPSGPAQAQLIREALAGAGVASDQVAYVEAHGTGTLLGDPIEIGALAEVFGARATDRPLLVGSVKTNIGHLEGAAGIAGLMKAVILVRDGKIAPHLHLKQPNPHIDWNSIPVRISSHRTEWPDWASRRIAGISSFGMSGMNAHILIENAVENAATPPAVGEQTERVAELLALSARNEAALRELIGRFCALEDADFADICFTANTGRTHFPLRVAVVAEDFEGMRALLKNAEIHKPSLPSPQVVEADYGNAERIAELYLKGAAIDWRKYYRGSSRRKISLPTYPFQRRVFWLSGQKEKAAALPAHPLLGKRLPSHGDTHHVWETQTDTEQFAYLTGHRINGSKLMPMSAYVEMARAAVGEALGVRVSKVGNLQLHHPFLQPENGGRTVQITVARNGRDTDFRASSRHDSATPWVLHATATVRLEA